MASQVNETKRTGGERGIRTPDTRKGIHAFEARAFSHSAISPRPPFAFILSGKLVASDFCGQLSEPSPAQPPPPKPSMPVWTIQSSPLARRADREKETASAAART